MAAIENAAANYEHMYGYAFSRNHSKDAYEHVFHPKVMITLDDPNGTSKTIHLGSIATGKRIKENSANDQANDQANDKANDTENSSKSRFNQPGITPKLVFHEDYNSISYLELQFIVVFARSLSDEVASSLSVPGTGTITHSLRFTGENLNLDKLILLEHKDLHHGTKSFELRELISKFKVQDPEQVINSSKQGSLLEMKFEFKSENRVARNFFVEMNNDQSSLLEPLRDHIIEGKSVKFNLLFSASNVSKVFDTLKEYMRKQTELPENTVLSLKASKYEHIRAMWKYKGQTLLQAGQDVDVGDLGMTNTSTSVTWFEPAQMLTTYYYLLRLEMKSVETNTERIEKIPGRIVLVPGSDRLIYFAVDWTQQTSSLSVGDTGILKFDHSDTPEVPIWGWICVTSPSIAHSSDKFLLATRPVIPKSETHDLDPLEFPTQSVLDPVGKTIEEATSIMFDGLTPVAATLNINTSMRCLQAQVNGLFTLGNEFLGNFAQPEKDYTGFVMQLALGSDIISLPKRLWTAGFMGEEVTADHAREVLQRHGKGLDDDQMQLLIDMINPCPGGIRVVYGGAGTGKTDVAVRLICAHLELCGESSGSIRVLTCTNNHTDSLASKVQAAVKTVGNREYMIIRNHAKTTEKTTMQRHASKAHQISKDPPQFPRPLFRPDNDRDSMNPLQDELFDLAFSAKETPIDGVKDRRVKLVDISTGQMVLNKLGMPDAQSWASVANVSTDNDNTAEQGVSSSLSSHEDFKSKYDHLYTYMRKYASGQKLSSNEKEQMTLNGNQARHDVLSNFCDVSFGTTGGSVMVENTEDYKTHLLIFDEASRMTYTEFLTIMLIYQPENVIMLGDPCQLGPSLQRSPKDILFGDELNTSALEVLLAQGHRQFMFTRQHRYGPEINSLMKNMAYKYQECAPNRQMTAVGLKVRQFLLTVLGSNHPVVAINIQEEDVKTTVTHSRSNPRNALFDVSMLCLWIGQGNEPKDILIQTAYRAQLLLCHQYVARLREKLSREEPNHRMLEIPLDILLNRFITWDDAQGSEASLIILDPSVSDPDTFLRSRRRCTTGVSRAKDGVIALCDTRKLTTMVKSTSREGRLRKNFSLNTILAHCYEHSSIYNIDTLPPAAEVEQWLGGYERRNVEQDRSHIEPIVLGDSRTKAASGLVNTFFHMDDDASEHDIDSQATDDQSEEGWNTSAYQATNAQAASDQAVSDQAASDQAASDQNDEGWDMDIDQAANDQGANDQAANGKNDEASVMDIDQATDAQLDDHIDAKIGEDWNKNVNEAANASNKSADGATDAQSNQAQNKGEQFTMTKEEINNQNWW